MELQLAAIFKENMVVQREKPIAVFGTGEPGREISVSIGADRSEGKYPDSCGTSRSRTVVGGDGTWLVSMPPLPAGEGLTLIADDGKTHLTVGGVAVGEVWFAGGQSNMEMTLAESEGGCEAARCYQGDRIRRYRVPVHPAADDALTRLEADTEWQIVSCENAGQMSAIAFYFAEKLAEKTGCIVGVIECFLGGSSIACWMSSKALLSVSAGQKLYAEYDAVAGGQTAEQYEARMAEYDKVVQAWQEEIDACQRQHPDYTMPQLYALCGEYPWPEPAGWQSPFAPCNLHTSMTMRVAPYSLRGFLYYQGEEDTVRHEGYYELMERLVRQWRTDFRDMGMPFLFVQLPMYLPAGEADDRSWAMQRARQELAFRMLRNTGMITMTDCGEYGNIHPTDKRTPADRLFRLAERMVYDADGEHDKEITPIMQSVYSDGENAYLTFSGAGDGLVLRKTEKPTFEAAGADGIFYPAQAEVVSRNTLKISCGMVSLIFEVRYAWYNFGEAALFNAAGMPVSSFCCLI